jgi:hypothetical protein
VVGASTALGELTRERRRRDEVLQAWLAEQPLPSPAESPKNHAARDGRMVVAGSKTLPRI